MLNEGVERKRASIYMHTGTPNERAQEHSSKCRRREGANHVIRHSVLVPNAWEDDGYCLEPHLKGVRRWRVGRRDHARYRLPNLEDW